MDLRRYGALQCPWHRV